MRLSVDFEPGISLTCSFTGYRPEKLPFKWDKSSGDYLRLYDVLKSEIEELSRKGVKYFQTGMARGIDLMCGEIVLELKKSLDIELICVIPCLRQYTGWASDDISMYHRLMDESSGIVEVTSDTYKEGCMQKRNRVLVDTAQYIIAVFDGQRGGTMSTINYAKKQKRTIIIIDPSKFSRTELIHGNDEGVLYV